MDFIARDEKLGKATAEEEQTKSEIQAGIKSEDELHKIQQVISSIELDEAMGLGDVVTSADNDLLVECETGQAEVRLEEHTRTASGDPIVEGDMAFHLHNGSSLLEVQAMLDVDQAWAGTLWPGCTLHFCYHPDISASAKWAWDSALQEMRAKLGPFDFYEYSATKSWGSSYSCTRRNAVMVT